jgi:hypothetical protein
MTLPPGWARPRAAMERRAEFRIALPPRLTGRSRAVASPPPPVVRTPPAPPLAPPPPLSPRPRAITRVVVLGPTQRVEPRVGVSPLAVGTSGQAGLLGIVQGGSTSLTMVPANLTRGPRTDVVNFRIISLDAGVY